MKVFMIGADATNSTDGVIVEGIRNVLNEYLFISSVDYYYLNDYVEQSHYVFNPNEQYDLFVVCGTPWLWDQFQKSVKYKNLLTAINTHPESKIIFMGVGSCVGLGLENTEILRRPDEQEAMRHLFTKGLCIVRDTLAHRYLTEAGVDSHCLPCPSYYCYGTKKQYFGKDHYKNVMIYYDASTGLSKSVLNDEYYSKINQKFINFNNNFNPIVYSALSREISKAEEINIRTPRLLQGWRHTLEIMKSTKRVLSGRVHCAVPAIAAGCEVELIPIDSRHLVVEDFRNVNVFNYLDQYSKLLRSL